MSDELELLRATRLTTSRYQWWTPSHGVPIRSTVGYPKFWKAPTNGRLVFVKQLAPYGMLKLSGNAFRHKYGEQLDRQAEEIVSALANIAREHPGKQLCIMCFEDVYAGEHCHRRDFADWAEQRFGLVVPELPKPDGGMTLTAKSTRSSPPSQPSRRAEAQRVHGKAGQPQWVKTSGSPTVAHYDPECFHFRDNDGIIRRPPRLGTPEELARCRPCSSCKPRDR